jgi:hypothetical protein
MSIQEKERHTVSDIVRGLQHGQQITMNFGEAYDYWYNGHFEQIAGTGYHIIQQRKKKRKTRVDPEGLVFRFKSQDGKHDEDEVKWSEEMVDHYEDADTVGGWFLGICLFCCCKSICCCSSNYRFDIVVGHSANERNRSLRQNSVGDGDNSNGNIMADI